MPKVCYSLLNKKCISLSFNHKYFRFRAFTGQYCDPKYWNSKAQRARGDSKFPEYLILNNLLNEYSERVMNHYRDCLIKDIPLTRDGFLKAMKGSLIESSKNPYLVDLIQIIMNERKNNPEFSINTIKKYNSTKRLFLEFTTVIKKNYKVSEIGLDEMNLFKKFLFEQKNYSVNSASKYLKQVKTFLNEAKRRDYFVNDKYNLCKSTDQQVLKTYLTTDDISLLLNYKFEPRLQNAVDLFLIGVFTGLRFSDFSQLKPENKEQIESYEFFRVKQAKTKQMILIPIHQNVKMIMARNKGLPRQLSQQRLNDYIKEACHLAGITQSQIRYFNEAGYNKSEVVQKYQTISTHTARRSFATNAYKMGLPAQDIMKITGHRTEASFKRYICMDLEESALKIAKSAFFS